MRLTSRHAGPRGPVDGLITRGVKIPRGNAGFAPIPRLTVLKEQAKLSTSVPESCLPQPSSSPAVHKVVNVIE